MTKRKLTLRVPTHELVADGVVYAHIRCGKGGSAAMKLLSTGEVARSARTQQFTVSQIARIIYRSTQLCSASRRTYPKPK
jgi:hypothetical protein